MHAWILMGFLALISYVLGEAMAVIIPRRGIFKCLNPFPFKKKHVAILISKLLSRWHLRQEVLTLYQ
jgi:hypothetical protein